MSTATTHIKTDNQLVPALRFKGFEGDWDLRFLSEFINDMGSGWSPTCLAEAAIKGEWGSLKTTSITWKGYAPEENKKLPEKLEPREDIEVCIDDVLITRVGPKDRVGVVVHVDKEWDKLMVSDNMFRLKLKGGIEPSFMPLILGSYTVQKEWKRKIAGLASAQVVINMKTLNKTTLNLPTLPEQQKIASFLSAVDEKIQQLTKKKALLKQYKKGVMQQLFSGQLRFKDENGNPYPDWEPRKMSEVLFEHKLNSTGNEDVFSVSVNKGLVNQVEHLGRVFAAKNTDNYNLVQPGDIVYTKSPTGSFPLGIIKQSKIDKNVIVSPLYGIFTPETAGLGYMFNVFFESPINTQNYLASIIQKGAKNTINITNTTFLSKKMKLPVSREEQNRIGDFLSSLDTKIESVTNQITQTQTFKKGLLQQMFV